MRQKLFSILALLLVAATGAWAQVPVWNVTLETNKGQTSYNGSPITISCNAAGNGNGFWLNAYTAQDHRPGSATISCQEGKLITTVVLTVGDNAGNAGYVTGSPGNVSVTDGGSTITINNVNASSLSLGMQYLGSTMGTVDIYIKAVTVYYTLPTLSESLATPGYENTGEHIKVTCNSIYNGAFYLRWNNWIKDNATVSTLGDESVNRIISRVVLNNSFIPYTHSDKVTSTEGTVSATSENPTITIDNVHATSLTLGCTNTGANQWDYVTINSVTVYYYEVPAVTGVTLSQTEATLPLGQTLTLTPSISPADAWDPSVTWTSSNTAVATVSNEGVVTTVAAGSAIITVTATNGTDDTNDDKTATCTVTVSNPALSLSEATDNSTALITANGKVYDVTLTRTLQTGGWNTFCAPFSTATPSGWTVKELSSSAFDNSTGELTLNFGNAASIEAGKPYLVKVDANVANPTFNGVTISSTTATTETTAVDFVPVMNPTNLIGGDKTVLFVSGGNKLTYPSGDGNINGFRAYFKLKDEVASARAFRMSFDDDATGIMTVLSDETTTASGTYTIDGLRIEGQPTQKGIYIVNGKKVIIK